MLQKIKYSDWLVIVFFILLFTKVILFHYFCFESYILSSIIKNPELFWRFYMPKISICILISSLVYLLKNKKWSILIYSILDLWMISNLCYYRLNNFLIDSYALSMVGNMDGFWDSSLLLFEYKDLIFPITTIIYGLCLFLKKGYSTRRNIQKSLALVIVFLIFHSISMSLFANYKYSIAKDEYEKYTKLFERQKPKFKDYIYISTLSEKARRSIFFEGTDYNFIIKQTSIIHSIFYNIIDIINLKNSLYICSEAENKEINCLLNKNANLSFSDEKIILIFIESLESWAINNEIMPNLCRFIERSSNLLYTPQIKSQIRQGSSSDGQFIVNTGLLPIKNGAVVFRYPFNKYPAFSHFATNKTITILPHKIHVWNQRSMSPAYGYDTTVVCGSRDDIIFNNIIKYANEGYQIIQTMTLLSHAPFDAGSKFSNLSTDANMPSFMSKYLKCMNYTDECLDILFQNIYQGGILSDYTILLTSDHNIFYEDKRLEFNKYSVQYNKNYQPLEPYIPLIIYSKLIKEKIIIKNCELYQMDIYPTILDILIENNDCQWNGLGISLLDSIKCEDRKYSEDYAYYISDIIIRSNYFNEYLGNVISKPNIGKIIND